MAKYIQYSFWKIVILWSLLPDWTRLWAGHEPHQPPRPDPASQEGEGAGVCAALRKGDAQAPRIHHAGKEHCFYLCFCFFLNKGTEY